MSSDPSAGPRAFSSLVESVETLGPSQFSLDGMTPGHVFRPQSESELQEIVRAAGADQLSMIPWGGGSQMGFGNVPSRYDVGVELTGLNQVLRYEPDDMTMSVQAGCKLGDLNAMLHEHRQVLPVDAANPARATIGGLVATGVSGPRRFGYGPLRDLIIGLTVLMADGTIAKAGGQVVKNVTGYDMMRLHHGALGSLGVILSVNLKVIPKPQSERTVLASYPTPRDADQAALAVSRSQLGITSVVVLNPAAGLETEPGIQPGWSIAVRCEAPPTAVVRQAERVVELLGEGSEQVRVESDTNHSEGLWLRICEALDQRADSADIVVRLGCPPSRLSHLSDSIDVALGKHALDARVTLDYGSGLAYARLERDRIPDAELHEVCRLITDLGEHVSLFSGPLTLKEHVDVFGPEPAGFSVIQSLKSTFDPNGVFNSGRYIGRL